MTRLPIPALLAVAAGGALLAVSASYWLSQGEAIILALANFVCL